MPMVHNWYGNKAGRYWHRRPIFGTLILGLTLLSIGCQDQQTITAAPSGIQEVKLDDTVVDAPVQQASQAAMAPPPATLTAWPTSTFEPEQSPEPAAKIGSAPLTLQPTLVPSATQLPNTPTTAANDTSIPSVVDAPLLTPTMTITPTISGPDIFSIGESVQGRPIYAYQFSDGQQQIVIVGGIHGGYEWNTILLAYELIDYFQSFPETIPENVALTIIPSANPDGQVLVTGKEGRFTAADVAENSFPGRFNANNVDLNRNWDCEWATVATWRNQPVSGGTAAFSEPESVVLRNFFLTQQTEAVIFLHSAANGVFAAGCPETHLDSMLLAQAYGAASGYPVYERFTSYPITGDAGDWLTMQGISSITIELLDHQNTEWSKNLTGILAVLDYYK